MSHNQLKLGYIEHNFNNVYIIKGSYFLEDLAVQALSVDLLIHIFILMDTQLFNWIYLFNS